MNCPVIAARTVMLPLSLLRRYMLVGCVDHRRSVVGGLDGWPGNWKPRWAFRVVWGKGANVALRLRAHWALSTGAIAKSGPGGIAVARTKA